MINNRLMYFKDKLKRRSDMIVMIARLLATLIESAKAGLGLGLRLD